MVAEQNQAIASLRKALAINPSLIKSLEGTPRFEAIQAQILEHLNAERARLDLEPLGLDRA